MDKTKMGIAKSTIPHFRGLPYLGHALEFSRNTLGFIEKAYRELGPVFEAHLLKVRLVFLVGPEANKFVLFDNAPNLTWREGFEPLLGLLGHGLLVTDGNIHDQLRETMQPGFHHERLEHYFDLMVSATESMIRQWQVGDEFDLFEAMRDCTLKIIMRCLFDMEPAIEHGNFVWHLDRMLAASAPEFAARALPPTLWGSPAFKATQSKRILDHEIDQMIEAKRSQKHEGSDIVSMLLHVQDHHPQQMTNSLIRDQIYMMMIAGHDTTTSAIASALWNLLKHPEIQHHACAELDNVMGARAPCFTQLGSLQYLQLVISETLRLYPPAWVGSRFTTRPCQFGEFSIPAGVHLAYCNWLTQRSAQYFPNPLVFNPSRFANPEKILQNTYMPFGGGLRNCIGKAFAILEMKVILAMVLRRVELIALDESQVHYHLFPTLKPSGMRVKVRKLLD